MILQGDDSKLKMESKSGIDGNYMACKLIILHLSFIFIEMKFYSLSFLCDVCNEVHEYMQ